MNIADCPTLKSVSGRCKGKWLIAHAAVDAPVSVIHVLPGFGRTHVENASCWCQPRWDDSRDDGVRILVHECDN
jgi:hypothetical protein